MGTFRKDIHLGRVVPMTPDDERNCMFVSLTATGIATDKYGRLWQLTPYTETLNAPTFSINLLTKDGYPSGSIYSVAILSGDTGVTISYKMVEVKDDGTEVADSWQTYKGSFEWAKGGTWKVVAKCVLGDKESDEATSDQFVVTVATRTETYNSLAITAFGYKQASADGETLTPNPALVYKQTHTTYYTDGTFYSEDITTGATIKYYKMNGTEEGDELDGGSITIDAATSSQTDVHDVCNVKAVVTLNDQTAEKTVTIKQSAYTINTYAYYGLSDSVPTSLVGTKVALTSASTKVTTPSATNNEHYAYVIVPDGYKVSKWSPTTDDTEDEISSGFIDESSFDGYKVYSYNEASGIGSMYNVTIVTE